MKFLKTIAHQRKNGNQQRRNAPIIIPSVLAALCSARQLFVCCRIEVPETHNVQNYFAMLFDKAFQAVA